jgi:hypothetical protein
MVARDTEHEPNELSEKGNNAITLHFYNLSGYASTQQCLVRA